MTSRPRIVIAGGGFAGLETAFTVRQRLGDGADLTLVSDRTDFLFKPNTIYVPFGLDVRKLLTPLAAPLTRRDIAFRFGKADHVDIDRKRLHLSNGSSVAYDYLVLATGASMRPREVPGLAENAQTIWTPAQMRSLGDRLRSLLVTARQHRHCEVLFLVPPQNKCSGPLYEMVFMLETWLRRHRIRDQVGITWATYESSYIQAFGPRLNEVVTAEFDRRQIEGYTDAVVSKVLPHEVVFADGSTRTFDLLISFPPYVAGTRYAGLPSDDRGFVTTELATRRVVGHPDIYAPGDTGDFPVKQAFLAFLQADAAADDIAARVQPTLAPEVRPFEPTSMCVMEMFDTATFAQVPLQLTGDAARPVRVRPDADGLYRVGVSPIWRLGKKVLGIYLPWQFGAGRPFHGGRAWSAMAVALAGMSRVLASGARTEASPAEVHRP